MTADAREMARRLQAVGGEIEAFDPDDLEQSAWLGLCDCAIDALLGVGLKARCSGPFWRRCGG